MQVEKKYKTHNGTTALTICTIDLTAPAPLKKGYPINPTNYGEHLRKIRMDLNLTQRELATILEVYTSSIDKWERGETEPNIKNRQKIIEFLGYDPMQKVITI